MDSEHPEIKEILRLREMLLITGNLDPLTEIGSRRYFDHHSKQLWQQHLEHNLPLSCVLIDIDFCKAYNDHFGHQSGDKLLMSVAHAIVKTLESYPNSLVARYGGEEFIVLLANTDIKQASVVAEAIREAVFSLRIAHPHSEVGNYFVTVSLGVESVIPTLESSLKPLIEGADRELYKAKERGRNRVCTSETEEMKYALTWCVLAFIKERNGKSYALVGVDNMSNPYMGDIPIDMSLPILCIKKANLPKPGIISSPTQTPGGAWRGTWSGGYIGLTKPVQGKRLTSLAIANQICEESCGTGYRMAEFHDGASDLWSGWDFWGEIASRQDALVFSHLGFEDLRFWVSINDKNSNPWGALSSKIAVL